jgi:hypothetical protein
MESGQPKELNMTARAFPASRCGSISAHLLRGLADLLLGQDKPDRSHIGQAKALTEPNSNQ